MDVFIYSEIVVYFIPEGDLPSVFELSGFVVKLCFALSMKPVCELRNNATDAAFYFADLICRIFVSNIPLRLSI